MLTIIIVNDPLVPGCKLTTLAEWTVVFMQFATKACKLYEQMWLTNLEHLHREYGKSDNFANLLPHPFLLYGVDVSYEIPPLNSVLSSPPTILSPTSHSRCHPTSSAPVSRIEFTLKSSVYWPIIGLGTRT